MPLTEDQITAVQAKRKPAVAEILKVWWNDATIHYYASRAYNEIPPFHRLAFQVEPRLIYSDINDPFSQFDINPDLRTETIPFVFDDLDKSITGLFQTHGSGVKCEIFYYYPNEDDPTLDIFTSMWFGQLKAPDIYGWRTLRTEASNGFRSREAFLPGSMRPQECRTRVFGGRLPTLDAIRTNLCPYDKHLGGTNGINDPGTSQPFLDCPRRSLSDCSARFGHSRFFGGYNTDASATVSDPRSGYIAHSKGNGSALKEPVRVIAGEKYVRALQLLLWRREVNAQTPDHGWVATVWEVGEGPNSIIRDPKINEKYIEALHFDPRYGARGQSPVSNYNPGGTISNFSGVGHFSARYGWVNALEVDARSMQAACRARGYREVAVFNDTAAGNGLIGTYKEGTDFSGTEIGERVDYEINFPTMFEPPFEGLPNFNWCVEWNGFISFPFTGNWTIEGNHDDGMYVEIDSNVIFDELTNNGTHTGVFNAPAANTPYPIRVKLIQETFSWYCNLQWENISQAKQVIPNSRLTHNGSSGFVRQWTDDRIWWLMECHTNQRFGMGYPFTRFTNALSDWIDASQWGLQTVQFQHTFPDGETATYTRRRTTFDASLEGRAAVDQITDIARSGGVTVPFQHDGAFTLTTLTKATTDELTDALVFTDTGESRNIVWADGAPAITFSQIPDDRLTNEIILTFEAHDNFDTERPITVDDPDQKLKAGRVLGEDMLQTVPMRFAAFGVRFIEEAIRLGYRLLWFGEFDSGGTKNNLKGRFLTPLEQVLGLKRYQFIKIESALLDEFELPGGDPVEYFRVLNLKKVGNGLVEMICQAYNHDQYTAFETVTVTSPAPPGPHIPSNDPPPGNPCTLTLGSVEYNANGGFIEVPVVPC